MVNCKNVIISMLPFKCILGKEEKFYAQSNHLNSIVNLHSYWTTRLHRLISNRNTDNNSYLNEGK